MLRSFILLTTLTLLASLRAAVGSGFSRSPETFVSDPVWTFARASRPHVASYGKAFLAAWQGAREDAIPAPIRVARITRDGVVQDQGGILLSTSGVICELIWNGTDYVIFINTLWNGIVAQRITNEGFVLGEPVRVRDVFRGELSVASNGTYIILIRRTTTYDSSSPIWFELLVYTRDLTLHSRRLVELSSFASASEPAIVSNGRNFLVVWAGAEGKLGDAPALYTLAISGESLDPGLPQRSHWLDGKWPSHSLSASDGDGYLHVARSADGTLAITAFDRIGRRVSEPTELTAAEPLTLSDVLWSGSNYFVLTGGPQLYSVTPDGQVAGRVEVTGGATVHASGARAGNRMLIAWTRENGTVPGALFSDAGVKLKNPYDVSEFPIAEAFGSQADPSAAFDGERHLVAWAENADVKSQIFVSRVSASGDALDGRGIRIAASDNDQIRPTVLFDGRKFTVLWYEIALGKRPDIAGRFVGVDGVPIGNVIAIASQVSFPNFPGSPAAATNGTDILVVFTRYEAGVRRLFGSRLRRDGLLLDGDGFPIANPPVSPLTHLPHETNTPSVAFAGGSYFVAWTELIPIPPQGVCQIICGVWFPTQADVMAARVSLAGTVLEERIPIATSSVDELHPHVVSLGPEFMVLWRTLPSYVQGAKRFTSQGRFISHSDAATSLHGWPRATAFDGRDVLLIANEWIDNGLLFQAYRVRPEGDRTLFGRVDSIRDTRAALGAIVATAEGEFRLFYAKHFPELGGGTTRIVTRQLSGWPQPRSRGARR